MIGDLGVVYRVTSIPSLLAFSRGEPQMETMIRNPRDIKSKEFLRQWLETEARRGGEGGVGGSLFGGLFGGR